MRILSITACLLLILAFAACDDSAPDPASTVSPVITPSSTAVALPTRTAVPVATPTAAPVSAGVFEPLHLMPDEVAVIEPFGSPPTTLLTTNDVVNWLDWLDDETLIVATRGLRVDQGRLVYSAALSRIDVATARSTLLLEAEGSITFDVSPDRAAIAVRVSPYGSISPNRNLIIGPDGTPIHELELDRTGRWAPDGRFYYLRGEELWAFDQGSSEVRVLVAPELQRGAWYTRSFSPDPSSVRIASVRYEDGAIDVVDVKRASLSTITTAGNPKVGAWSRDGRRLLYATGVTYDNPAQLWVFDAESGNSTLIQSSIELLGGMDWSPEGNAVAYSVHDGSLAGVYRHDLASGGTEQLSTSAEVDVINWLANGDLLVRQESCWMGCEPGWVASRLITASGEAELPVGTQPSFSQIGEGPASWGYRAVAYLTPDEQAVVLEERPDTVYSRVATSPSGDRVAYSRSAWAYALPFVIDPSSGSFTRLAPLPSFPANAQATPSAVAPDGRTATLRHNSLVVRSGDAEAVLATLPDGGCGGGGGVQWSPDGKFLSVLHCAGVYVVEVNHGAWRALAVPAWCPFPGFAHWTPENKLVITYVSQLC